MSQYRYYRGNGYQSAPSQQVSRYSNQQTSFRGSGKQTFTMRTEEVYVEHNGTRVGRVTSTIESSGSTNNRYASNSTRSQQQTISQPPPRAAVQCQGTTQRGERCQTTTDSSNRYWARVSEPLNRGEPFCNHHTDQGGCGSKVQSVKQQPQKRQRE